MKKPIYILISLVMLLITNPIFAQEDPGADPDAPAAPIDDYVWFMAAIGLVYVFLRIRAYASQTNSSRE